MLGTNIFYLYGTVPWTAIRIPVCESDMYIPLCSIF
jgi:hypothetical protein